MRQEEGANQKTEWSLLKYKRLWSKSLLDWYAVHGRDLPWRRTRNPYAIWLSGVLLQQTRVDQGLSYYLRFLDHFPTVQELAQADIQDVLRLWQGLGYYRRAHHLHCAAKLVVEKGGGLPQSPAEWLQLPGVGPYTAAAIASIAQDYPAPVVDGNVIRVLSRAFGAEAPYDTAEGLRWIRQTAQDLLDTDRPGDYNQALMDMGATVCTPQKPACNTCFWQKKCVAFLQDRIGELPKRSKSTKVVPLTLDYLVLFHRGRVLLFPRRDQGIWAGLYEFLPQPWAGAWDESAWDQHWGSEHPSETLSHRLVTVSHALSHRSLTLNLNCIRLNRNLHLDGGVWVTLQDLERYPLPQPFLQFLKQIDFNHGRTQQSHAHRQPRQGPRSQNP